MTNSFDSVVVFSSAARVVCRADGAEHWAAFVYHQSQLRGTILFFLSYLSSAAEVVSIADRTGYRAAFLYHMRLLGGHKCYINWVLSSADYRQWRPHGVITK